MFLTSPRIKLWVVSSIIPYMVHLNKLFSKNNCVEVSLILIILLKNGCTG